MKKEIDNGQRRQGDVYLVPVDAVPEGAVLVSQGRAIVAYGEVTGHAHRVAGEGVELWRYLETDYLVVARPHAVQHEEHAPMPVERSYRIVRQRVYTPAAIRPVAD